MFGRSLWNSARCACRVASTYVQHPESRVIIAFWLLGLINNVLYVIILSAAQDLVGTLPKGLVLLADVGPSFIAKLILPYFIHHVPYHTRVCVFIALSTGGMLLIALTPASSRSVAVKMMGVVLASLSSGGGELSFLGLSHYYGQASLAGWASGTGAAGLVGAGLYVALTDWWGFTVSQSLLASAFLPVVMLVSFFFVLPQEPLRRGAAFKDYEAIADADDEGGEEDENEDDYGGGGGGGGAVPGAPADRGLQRRTASPGALFASEPSTLSADAVPALRRSNGFRDNLRRARTLFVPYMVPLFLVYVAEYTINQGVSPTLLFPLASSPFGDFREFYPFYGFLYQLGVFVSRSSRPLVRIRRLYLPSLLQVGNLVLLTLHAMFFFIPSVYLVFVIVLWEGLLGGAVYVNSFAEIMENVPPEEREFSMGATTIAHQ
ncbi:Protein BTN1 [Escovopsis weberi]|uniref:Protein BTN n=1 Tax=Escovopsis weberi TaxID=150374 RepID=A0A0M9VUU6_ESCWE|nr:Protein BTN1 [Escovopsis weberi]